MTNQRSRDGGLSAYRVILLFLLTASALAVLATPAKSKTSLGPLEHLATPSLLDELSRSPRADAIIQFHSKVDIMRVKRDVESRIIAASAGSAIAEALSDSVAEELVKQLRLEAEATQRNLLVFLSTDQAMTQIAQDVKKPIRSLWIINAVAIKQASKELLMEIASRFGKDVRRIASNPAIQIPERVETSPGRREQDKVRPANRVQSSQADDIVEESLQFIQATDMWELGYEGEGITVAIIDTGIDAVHPALKKNYRGKDGNHNYNWFDPFDETQIPYDSHFHGTHAAGSVVGNDDTQGHLHVYGVAPKANLIGCMNLEGGGGELMASVLCWQFTLAPTDLNNENPDPSKRPHISSNSWGRSRAWEEEFDMLMDAADKLRAAGVFIVQSAGNDGEDGCGTLELPSGFENIFSVCSVNKTNGIIDYFSSRGPTPSLAGSHLKPDACAPGSDILSSVTGGGYLSMSGTSMATPHVAGAVALLWEALPDLRRNVAETEELLKNSAQRMESEDCGSEHRHPNYVYGHGNVMILDAYEAYLNSRPKDDSQPVSSAYLNARGWLHLFVLLVLGLLALI